MSTLMHCAPRRQIPRISCYTKLPIVVKGFFKDFNERFGIRSNGSGYPFEKNCHLFERPCLSVRKRNVIPSNDSGYPFQKNCHPFERLELSIPNNRPFHGLLRHLGWGANTAKITVSVWLGPLGTAIKNAAAKRQISIAKIYFKRNLY